MRMTSHTAETKQDIEDIIPVGNMAEETRIDAKQG